jgi:hypothetical protein
MTFEIVFAAHSPAASDITFIGSVFGLWRHHDATSVNLICLEPP